MIEKTPDGVRQIVGQIGLDHPLAIHLGTGGATGRGHAGQQDAGVRPTRLQRLDQGLGGTRFADRDGMHPDQRAVPGNWRPTIDAEAFADMRPVSRLFPPAQEQSQQDCRQQQVEQ